MKPRESLLPIDQVRARRLFFFLWKIGLSGRNIFLILLSNIVIGGLLISLFDGKSVADGQYLAFITAMTIGYGDVSPDSWISRIIACGIGVNGIVLTGVVVALTVKALELTFREELDRIQRESPDREV